ncbi:aminotransferase class V-fold PLP-dependent enzyme [Nubsella zeaxanthinifaciens]|uniref:aminotransferase class V-fold PLP-dependent enzyme n=1 Tax=Nubsella zeaxanthinifaciens TaxID=392412 RepID=UPI003D00E250
MQIDQIRQDTLGCHDKIFLNSAGASLMPKSVIQKQMEYLQLEQEFGGYHVASQQNTVLNEFYIEAAKLINCKPQNIAFATNATDAYAKALSSIQFKPGDSIVTTDDDYISNQIAFLSLQQRLNLRIHRVKKLANNEIDLNDFLQLVKNHQPKLVAVTHIPSNSGLIQNVEEIGEICKQNGILYLVDACQSVGQLLVDTQKIACDFLTATGRKFLRGPRGTGFLYVSDRVLSQGLAPLLLDMSGARWTAPNAYELSDDAKRFEIWERSCASVIGLTEAIRYANNVGMANIEAYNINLSSQLREMLQRNSNLEVLDKGLKLASIVTFHHHNVPLQALQEVLSKNNIYYSVSFKGGALIDFSEKNVDWAIRFSPHYFNKLEEMEAVTDLLSADNFSSL